MQYYFYCILLLTFKSRRIKTVFVSAPPECSSTQTALTKSTLYEVKDGCISSYHSCPSFRAPDFNT